MRVVSGPKLARLNASSLNFYAKVKVEDGDGVLRDTTALFGIDFFDGATWTENIDQPVASGTITLRREGTESDGTVVSLSPTMAASPANRKGDGSYAPLLAAARRVQILVAWTDPGVAPVDADWMLAFDGKIDKVNWKGLESLVTLDVRDRGAWLQDTFIENVKVYSDVHGNAVETIMQQILDDNPQSKLGAVTLYVPTSPLWIIKQFEQAQKSVLDALRDLAQQIGWDVRYKWSEADSAYRLTLFQPDRAKTDPDWTLGPDKYFEVTDLNQSDASVRNRIRVRTQSASGTPITSLYVDADSIAKYGERYMEVVEEATTNIDTQGEADDMTAAMGSDLSDPIADQEIENYLYPIAELGDMGGWLANGKQYDADQAFAVIQVKHEVSATKRRTYIQSRGRVAGAFNQWLKLENTSALVTTADIADTVFLKGWREKTRTATDITFEFVASPATTKIALYQWTKPVDEDVVWPNGTTPPLRWLTADTTEITVPFPADENTTYLSVEPYSDATGALIRGEAIHQRVFAVNSKPAIDNPAQQTAISGLFTAVSFDVSDSKLLGGVVKAWTASASENSADSSADPDGTVSVVSTPSHLDSTTVFTKGDGTTATLLANIPVHPGRGKRVYFEFVNTQGTSSGVIGINLLSQGGIIDANGDLIDAAIKRASQFAAEVQPVQPLSALPAGAPDGTVVLLLTDGQLYRRVGGAWTLEVPAVNISGTVVASQIANAAITTAKFAAGITPVELLATTTGAPGVGRIAYNTTDGKLYRSSPDGSAWVNAVATADLSGTITTAQIAVAAITNSLIAAAAVTTTSIADNSISTPKIIAGAVTAAVIAAGTITSTQIAANTIVASNIVAATITSTQLAAASVTATQLAAASVIAGKIAAAAVSTTELAASAVTAAKIAAGTITSNEIAANTITAGNIASATITATQIAAATITSTQMAANSIVAGKIAAGAINSSSLFVSGVVTATIISVSNLAAISSDLGIIVSGRLNSANGQSFINLNATGASSFIHHADSLGNVTLEILANGSATFSGTVASNNFTAVTATFNGIHADALLVGLTGTGAIALNGGGTANFPTISGNGTDLNLAGHIALGGGGTYGNVVKQSSLTVTRPVPGVTVSSSAPSSPGNYLEGDLWINTAAVAMHVLTGGAWTLASAS